MRLLFVHQNFPGQYCHIIEAIAAQGGHQIIGLGINPLSKPLPNGVLYKRYRPQRGNTPGIHPWILDTETKCIRGEACATAATELKQQGFHPDLICAHPGWGESLFLRDVWPQTPLLSYQEFFYQAEGFDYGFDREFSSAPLNWDQKAKIRIKTSFMRLVLEASSWNITPTAFQRSSFPQSWQQKISCLHDGIDTELAAPSTKTQNIILPSGTILSNDTPLVTFVNRVIEPYRGCHTFIRSIPALQRAHSKAEIVIVGDPAGDGYGPPPQEYTWKDRFLREIYGNYDPKKVHFVGKLTYSNYIKILQSSWVHVYLTIPFVLSWSLLEAMSCGCTVVGSATAPVKEVIRHKENGLLTDFFDPDALAQVICTLLEDRVLARQLGQMARTTIEQKYSLKTCLPRQLALIELVANGVLGR
jgi:glycosyltransferase involved in cell wall biosynthesis